MEYKQRFLYDATAHDKDTLLNLVHQVGAVAPVSTCTGRGASDRRSVRPCC